MSFTPLLTRLICLVTVLATVAAPNPAGAATPTWRWPTSGGQTGLIRPFQAPISRYGPGHRGVDLQVTVGQQVTAPASGIVLFNGLIARIPTLVLDHGGGLRSTYQPLTSGLRVGEAVRAGAAIGVIAKGGRHCLPRICLHFGVRNSAGYLDPIKLIHSRMPMLLPPLK